MAIADRVVIRADDLLSWCDNTINWNYGISASDTLKNTPEKTTNGSKSVLGIQEVESAAIATAAVTNVNVDQILNSNIRSLKNSKLDFSDVEKEKGKWSGSGEKKTEKKYTLLLQVAQIIMKYKQLHTCEWVSMVSFISE